MGWTKTKTAIVASAVVVIVAGTVSLSYLPSLRRQISIRAGQRMIEKRIAVPIALKTHLTTPVSRFDQITGFPAFKSIPRGFQVFNHVPFQIDGLLCLWGEGNAKNLKIVFPEQNLGIEVNQKLETLYIYHGSFFPSKNKTPVFQVVFRYEDGSSATNQLLYGKDVLDWTEKRSPNGAKSMLAWVGGTFTPGKDQPLRLCMTAVDNPRPLQLVTSIDLYSSKSQTAPAIMAMTIGRSGLMK